MSTDFVTDVTLNAVNRAILSRWHRLDLPNGWLVAGCLFQTVWNLRAGRAPESGIKDYDIFYFDPSDRSEAAETDVQAHTASVLGDLGVTIEVANQARVHLWYPSYFGRPYPELTSAEDGIGRFLVLETCVGVRPHECHAPYGLHGLYAGTLTPNPATPYRDLFASKVASYQERWQWLTVAGPPGDWPPEASGLEHHAEAHASTVGQSRHPLIVSASSPAGGRCRAAPGGTVKFDYRIPAMKFSGVYALYVQKAEKKHRTKEEVDQVIRWLTGYSQAGLEQQIEKQSTFESFFADAPAIHLNSALIRGVVCGVRVEEIDDPLVQKVRWLDKLIDELAKGKSLEKVMR